MSLRLKNPKKLPPGGFLFHESGRTFNEMCSKSGKEMLILSFRQDNNRPRATLPEVQEDLENYTVNLHPELAYDPGMIAASASSGRIVSSCTSCGGQAK